MSDSYDHIPKEKIERIKNKNSAARLLAGELADRTEFCDERIDQIIYRLYICDKLTKHLDLLVGDTARYEYKTREAARRGAEEEFMWVTNANVGETIELLLGSELVGDADVESLRRETIRTFRRLGESVFANPNTWASNRPSDETPC